MADKPSPAMIAALTADPQHRQRDMVRLRAEGVAEGRQACRKEVLDWLEVEHSRAAGIGDNAKAQATLELTRDLSRFLQGLAPVAKKRNPPKRPR